MFTVETLSSEAWRRVWRLGRCLQWKHLARRPGAEFGGWGGLKVYKVAISLVLSGITSFNVRIVFMTTETVFEPEHSSTPNVDTKVNRRVGVMLGTAIEAKIDMVHAAMAGVPVKAFEDLKRSGYKEHEITWIVKPRTLRDRKKQGGRLTPEESDRWLRAAKAHALAVEVFGNEDKAIRWLHKPRKAFGGDSAIKIIKSETGYEIVEEALYNIDSGHFA